jgi:hypothetical protein
MQICPHCTLQQLDGTLFCDECGASLLPAAPPAAARQPRRPPTADLAGDAAPAQRWWLIFPDSGRRVELAPAPQLILGRGGKASLDLNLDPEGTPAGVSATHAALIFRHGQWGIQDLGSTNGTYVNLVRLPRGQVFTVPPGSKIHFGALEVRLLASAPRGED